MVEKGENFAKFPYHPLFRTGDILALGPVVLTPHSSTVAMDAVKRLAEANPVVIFSKSSCSMTDYVGTLIRNFGANTTVYELDGFQNGQQMERALLTLGCNPSVPAVFIGNELVGGAKEITSLNVRGKLKQRLIDAGAIWV
ncbi:unnamed protein product [Ilex paraguariensis]|uniref:Glutaredoxin domain-containing protein n=1 Tax=Ilex paraguariensis TaxID=185542 RepID=A0ABC8SY63_9AQUA